MTFINHEQEVFWKIVQQSERRFTRLALIDMHRIVLDAVAISHLLHHLKIKHRAHADSLGFEQFILRFEDFQSFCEFYLDVFDGYSHAFFACHIMRRREDDYFTQIAKGLARDRVDDAYALNGVTEHLETRHCFFIRRMHFDRVSAHTKVSTTKGHVVSVILQIHESRQDTALVIVDSCMQLEQMTPIFARIAHAINATHRCDNDRVSASQQRRSCRMSEAINFIVD